jgi:hypothetical protein
MIRAELEIAGGRGDPTIAPDFGPCSSILVASN